MQTQHNIQFTRENEQLIVELHWDVALQLFGTLHANDFWDRLSKQTLNNNTVDVLAAEDLLFSLCIHGSRHLWERLAWICDVAELMSRCQFDWTALLKQAIAVDSERMFLLGVYLADGLLDARLPDDLKRHCENDPTVLELSDRVVENLFKGPEHVPATSAEVFRYNFEVRKTWRARARYLKYMMSPSDRDVAVRSLPHGLTFVYYFARPFRLLLKRGRTVIQVRNRL